MTNLTNRESATVAEVISLYDLTGAQEKVVWDAIEQRWHNTSGRFYAYTVAHEISADVINGRLRDVVTYRHGEDSG